MSTGETKETTTATTVLDADGGEERDQLSLLTLRLVSHHKRVSLFRRILSFHKTKGWSLTSNAGRDDMIFDPPKFQIPKI